MSVECLIKFSDGRELKISEAVSSGGEERESFLDCLASSLALVKEKANGILTEQVEKEKRVLSAPNKRETPDEELEDFEEDDDIEEPEIKSPRTT